MEREEMLITCNFCGEEIPVTMFAEHVRGHLFDNEYSVINAIKAGDQVSFGRESNSKQSGVPHKRGDEPRPSRLLRLD